MSTPAKILAVSVMPGPQMVSAVNLCRDFRRKHPSVPIVWGGYFPSLYTDAALNAGYVDFAIRGQGEETILELLAAVRGSRNFAGIRGLSYKDDFGLHVHNAERPLQSPNEFPWLPYHRLGSAEKYLKPTFLGQRTAVHQASIGCPFRCQFCGVVPIFDGRQKTEAPERTAAVLTMLQRTYGIDAVQFYDNNFFLNETHAREQARLLRPLGLRWWAEGRIDTFLRYSDDALRDIRDSGARMIFFGAESGSDEVLKRMNKGGKAAASLTLELAGRMRSFGIVPELSFVLGNPPDPAGDVDASLSFIRRLKRVNPETEMVLYMYTPVPLSGKAGPFRRASGRGRARPRPGPLTFQCQRGPAAPGGKASAPTGRKPQLAFSLFLEGGRGRIRSSAICSETCLATEISEMSMRSTCIRILRSVKESPFLPSRERR